MTRLLSQLIKTNIKPALAVALVSIPISISLSIAAYANPIVGIIASVVAGLVAAFIGSSNYNVIGPTGSITGILATFVTIYGPETIPMLAIIAGLFGLCAWALKLERYIIFIPASAIHGFVLGIALIVILGQINNALGLSELIKHDVFIYNIYESLTHLSLASFDATLVTFVFLILFIICSILIPQIPGTILLTPLGILVGYLAQVKIIPLTIATLGSKYGALHQLQFSMPQFTIFPSLLITGLAISFIAMLETLISGKISDGLTKTKHNRQQELLGLAWANIIAGLCGGMPSSASYARTSINIKNGATSKVSQGLSAAFTFLIAWFVLPAFSYLPLPVIAAMLIFVCYKMVEKQHLIRFYHHDKRSFAITLLVALVTLIENPVIGILFGTALACIFLVEQMATGYHETAEINQSSETSSVIPPKDVLIYSIKGPLVYINSQAHISRFEAGTVYKTVIIRMRGVHFIDSDGIDAFNEIVCLIEQSGSKIFLTSLQPHVEYALACQSKQYQELKSQCQIFKTTHDALAYVGIKQYQMND